MEFQRLDEVFSPEEIAAQTMTVEGLEIIAGSDGWGDDVSFIVKNGDSEEVRSYFPVPKGTPGAVEYVMTLSVLRK